MTLIGVMFFALLVLTFNINKIENFILAEEQRSIQYEQSLLLDDLDTSALTGSPQVIIMAMDYIVEESPRVHGIKLTTKEGNRFVSTGDKKSNFTTSSQNHVLENSGAQVTIDFVSRIESEIESLYQTLLITLLVSILVFVVAFSYVSIPLKKSLDNITESLQFYRSKAFDISSKKMHQWDYENEFNVFVPTLDKIYDWSKNQLRRQEQLENAVKRETRSKNVFIASMAHDFKTPLTTLEGVHSELMTAHRKGYDADFDKTFSMMLHVTNDMSLMVQTTLDFAKLESGQKSPIKPKRVTNFHHFIYRLVALHTYAASRNNNIITVEIDIESSRILEASIDASKYALVLRNILSNATKFVSNGVIEIKIRVISNGVIETKVIDDGEGIPQENIGKIFVPFEHAALSAHSGSGIGLSSAKMLLNEIGQNIVYDDSYAGACFKYTFPAKLSSSLDKFKGYSLLILDLPYGIKQIIELIEQAFNTHIDVKKPSEVVESSLSKYDQVFAFDLFDSKGTLNENFKDVFRSLKANKTKVSYISSSAQINKSKIKIYGVKEGVFTINEVYEKQTESVNLEISNASLNISESHKSLSILIVEDATEYLEILIKKLQRIGFKNIDSVGDGISAVERVKSHKYDFVIMDHMLPKLNGIKATERIREFDKEIKIYGFTAANQELDFAASSSRRGMDAVFIKDLNRMELLTSQVQKDFT